MIVIPCTLSVAPEEPTNFVECEGLIIVREAAIANCLKHCCTFYTANTWEPAWTVDL